MQPRPQIAALAVVLLTHGAHAQQADCPPMPAPTRSGPPVLHLSAHAAIKLGPDELVADLTALANSPTAVMAQRRVNSLMAEAFKASGSVTGVKASFKDYSVEYVDERRPHWTAQQILELRGGDSAALLDLVGRLQVLGLAVGDLDWQVSARRAEKAHQNATIAALKSLRTQAAADADALGLQIDHFRSIHVGEEPRVFPLPQARMNAGVAMAAAMPPPNTTPEQQEITATVSADVVMRAGTTGGRPHP